MSFVLVLCALLAFAGCAFFRETAKVGDPVKEFLAQVKKERASTFRRIESARKGKGPFDLQIVMRADWARRKAEEKESDALLLARTWLGIIRPAGPEKAWLEFVDSGGGVLAWGLFQSDKGLFWGLGKPVQRGRSGIQGPSRALSAR